MKKIIIFSLLLIFFTIPHTLEDFASGEPVKRGLPMPILALMISIIFSLQALGLFWLGKNQRRGFISHIVVGLFWPLASGLAQVPTILNEPIYRSGIISVIYVGGMIVIGVLLFVTSIMALKNSS